MECSTDQRRRDEEAARTFMEQMSDEALSGMIDMMREAAQQSPRSGRASLKIVKKPEDSLPGK